MSVGRIGAKGARSTPLIRPTMTWPPTRSAPEEPAETNASAFPSLTSFSPTTMEESFFSRIDATGASPVSMTWVAFTMVNRSSSQVCPFRASRISSSFPTARTCVSGLFFRASRQPFTTSAGALSPPIASTATLTISDSFRRDPGSSHTKPTYIIAETAVSFKNKENPGANAPGLTFCSFGSLSQSSTLTISFLL